METICPGCEQSISYIAEPPRFCQNCGLALASVISDASTKTAPLDVTIAPSTQATEPDKPTGAGEIVGPYRLERWLGSGGMGVVWEATETKTGRRVALKRLAKSMISDETYVKRFLREAQLVAQISHPKVTFIYCAGSEDDQPYIAMELMPGRTLEDKVKQEGPLPVPAAVDSILDVVDGLIAAHRLGMIHRDVKPANCFLAPDESVKIGDFGLSKSILNNDVNLTQTGTFMGTPSYAAPEQIRGGDLDGRTDVYAVGATLFHLLTARTPFKGDAMSITAQIVTDKAPSSREYCSDIPKDLDRVIAKCLEKDPAKRFQDLEQLKLALLPFATQRESIAEIGRRLAAYMIDQCLIQIVFTLVTFISTFGLIIYWQAWGGVAPGRGVQEKLNGIMPTMVFWGGTTSWLVSMLYYAIFEGNFGRGLGKRLMGLRVVNREGRRPGFWRAWLRSFIVPGCIGIPWALVIWQSNYGEPPVSAEDQLLNFLRGTLATAIPVLICASTMRVSNGLLGIHGMLSGTRVIRLNTGKQRVPVPVVQPTCNTIDIMAFGPYQTRELLGESQYGKVFIGHDAPLNRNVWIVEWKDGTEPSHARINLARVSRQRWLEGGNLEDGTRWDAFEAIQGVPVQTFVGIQKQADWTHYRQIKSEIVEELRQAIDDGTLPETLSLPQIWLDEDGHAKLLDKQLVNVIESTDSTSSADASIVPPVQTDSVERAVGLVQQLGDLFHRTKVLPSSVQDFLIELKQRPKNDATLGWAGQRLKELSKNLGSLAWDTRLGILGATMGIELVINILVAGCIFLFCYYLAPIPNEYRFFVGVVGGLVLPVIFSIVFCGGPVFQFMGIQVCNSRGRPAGKLTCMIRAAITWMPVIALLGAFLMLMIFSETVTSGIEPETGSIASDMKENPWLGLSVLAVIGLSGLVITIGMLFSILSPKKGMVDYLLRTQLMPK